MPHIDDGTLHALLDGALRTEAPEEAAAAEAHLEHCPDCRARLDEAAALRDAATVILAAGPEAVDATPDFDDVMARSEAREAADPDGAGGREAAGALARRRRRLAWTRGAAWAATLVLALGTGYLIRDLAGPEEVFPPTTGAPTGLETAESDPTLDDAAAEAAGADRAADAAADRLAEKTAREREVGEAARRQVAAAPQSEPAAGEAWAREATPGAVAGAPMADAAPVAEAAPAVRAEEESAESAGRWVAATVDEVAAVLGGPLYLLPRAEVTELYVGDGADGPAALSIQRLSSGVPIRVVQRRPPDAPTGTARAVSEDATAAADAPNEAAAPAEAELSLRATGEGVSRAAPPPPSAGGPALPPPETAQVIVEGFVLELTGSLPADLLAILGTAARPAAR